MYGFVRGVPGNRHSYRDFDVDNLWEIPHLNQMPRRACIDAPGALHHIIIRGIEGKAIFKDDTDREDFIERLSSLLQETATPCYALALMTNHVHLLLRTGTVPIASIMRRVLTGYAVRFNRKHRRHGHLFQNRYK